MESSYIVRKININIVDLIANAERRYKEGRYDDATARLYRTIELIAQYRLKSKYGIDTSDVDVNKLSIYLEDEYEELRDKKGKIRLSLTKDYELFNELGDGLGGEYLKNEKLKDLIGIRNFSILAHGLSPVSKNKCEEFYSEVKELAKLVVSDLEDKLSKARFPKFGELGYA